MPRGGKRDGAGRKPGEAWKSRRPETVTAAARAKIRAVLETEADPVTLLVRWANDASLDMSFRRECAVAAAPYIAPRLSASVSVDATPKHGTPDRDSLLASLMSRFDRLAAPATPVIEAAAEPAPEAAG